MVVSIEEFLRKTQRYMELAEKIDLYVVERGWSVVWHIHCRNGSLWDYLADGLMGLIGEDCCPQIPLQSQIAC